jgi:acyl-CoA reductase-like NAD-dependent aldehyde dehydrogenase
MAKSEEALPESVATWLRGPRGHVIGGEIRSSISGATMEVENPATGEVIATVARADAQDIDTAVRIARETFDQRVWRGMQVDQRARVMWQLGDLLDGHAEEVGTIQTLENGMPISFAIRSIRGAGSWMRSFAGFIKNVGGRAYGESISTPGNWHAYTRKEPVGVAGLITPWNGPLSTLVIKAAPALAAGCSIVAKPSELTPLACLRLGELALEAGLPAGVFNIVPGFGPDAGQALAEHPLVSKISFTGSTAVGKHLVRTAADDLKRVTLELGGKSPCIIFDDADLDIAIPGAAMAIFMNSGQACIAGSRLFVQDAVFDKVVAGIVAFADKLTLGNGLTPDVDLGPLISSKQRERVAAYIDSGREEGAEVVAGGVPVEGPGYFLRPTVFVNTRPDMKIIREEIFGPVLSITRFRDIDELPALANATEYGLAAGIYTTDVRKVHRVAALIEAGSVYVNCYSMFDAVMPFGGYKQSGWGRELGEEGMSAFLESKSVYVNLN